MEEEGRRVADRLDVGRKPPVELRVSRHVRDPQHDERDDAERMGLAEAAVLEDPEACQAHENGRDHVDLPERVPRGYLLVAYEGDEAGGYGNQADRGMNHA